jgi:hypothetical protein
MDLMITVIAASIAVWGLFICYEIGRLGDQLKRILDAVEKK